MPPDSDVDRLDILDEELEGYALSDIDAFEELPLWRLFIEANERRRLTLVDRVVMGDVELYVQADPNDYVGYKLRTNEAMRGAIIELEGINLFLVDVRTSITTLQEELQSQEEEILEDV